MVGWLKDLDKLLRGGKTDAAKLAVGHCAPEAANAGTAVVSGLPADLRDVVWRGDGLLQRALNRPAHRRLLPEAPRLVILWDCPSGLVWIDL